MVKKRKIKAIYFDIGYTLCAPATGDWRATKEFYKYVKPEYFASMSKEQIKNAFVAGYKVLNEKKLVKTLEEELQLNVESYRAMLNAFENIEVSEDAIYEIAKDRTYNMDNYIFYDGVKEVFEQLSKKYKIGIISDTWPSADNMLKKAGVYEYIDSFTYSCNIGTEKPDIKMYKHALEQLSVKAEESIFIDDSFENLKAAEKLGMTPILILTKESKGSSYFCEIESIRDVLEVIESVSKC